MKRSVRTILQWLLKVSVVAIWLLPLIVVVIGFVLLFYPKLIILGVLMIVGGVTAALLKAEAFHGIDPNDNRRPNDYREHD